GGALLEIQPAHRGATPQRNAFRALQLQAIADAVTVAAFDQFIEETAHLTAVARNFRGAFFLFVQFLQNRHRDEDVVLLEAEQRRGVMQQHVGIESVDALASGHTEETSRSGRWRKRSTLAGTSDVAITWQVWRRAPPAHGRALSRQATVRRACRRDRSGKCCAPRRDNACRTTPSRGSRRRPCTRFRRGRTAAGRAAPACWRSWRGISPSRARRR